MQTSKNDICIYEGRRPLKPFVVVDSTVKPKLPNFNFEDSFVTCWPHYSRKIVDR